MKSGGRNGKGVSASASATGGLGSIPAASRKVVQTVKEIVNCPEAEIYATLRECNMDPNEAVSRLLTQDTFREVKSKREKKKENKDTSEYRPRGTGIASNRSGRDGTDRRSGSTHYNYSESGNLHERPAYGKENGANAHVVPNSISLAANTDVNRHFSAFSDNVPKESKLTTTTDSFSSSFPTSSGFHPAWRGGTVGHMSMADIVKKGKPQNKAPGPVNKDQNSNRNHTMAVHPPVLPHQAMSGSEPDVGRNQHNDEWPAIKHHPSSTFPSIHAIENLETTSLHMNGTSQNIKSVDTLSSIDGTDANFDHNHGVTTAANIYFQEDNSGDASYYDNNVYVEPNSYQQFGHEYEHEEAEYVSDMAANMQQLTLEKDEHVQQVQDETCTVVIPDHLQVRSSECLNLSFGSFGPGIAAGLAGPNTAEPVNSDVEEQSEEDASPVVHSDFRNPENHGDEQSRSISPEDIMNSSGVTVETHRSISPSQPDYLNQDIPSEAGVQYAYHNSLPGYTFNKTHQQQVNSAFPQSQTSSQMLNPTLFSNVMAHTHVSPGSMLASSVQQPVRESDLYSQFHAIQLMAGRFGNPVSVDSSPASGAEALDTSNISSSQQVLPNANVASTGADLPQHLAMHHYSQPTLPLGPFTNMISYPFLPQSYTYMPSPFQQAFNGNSSYHQSLAAVPPQYKSNIPVNSLPHSGAIPSSYAAFGRSPTNVPGNFSLNQNAAPGSSTIGYDELMGSHYKEQLLALQQAQLQNENSAMFAHGNSRTMSAVPANTYYNLQGQNQQPGGFRQNQQQPSQHFGSPGYPNVYHSQSGMSTEHQQQNSRDGSIIAASQVQPPKQPQQQQMWQNGY